MRQMQKNTIEIADGALNEVSSILQRIRELSVQAANGTNADSDKQAAQDEIEKAYRGSRQDLRCDRI